MRQINCSVKTNPCLFAHFGWKENTNKMNIQVLPWCSGCSNKDNQNSTLNDPDNAENEGIDPPDALDDPDDLEDVTDNLEDRCSLRLTTHLRAIRPQRIPSKDIDELLDIVDSADTPEAKEKPRTIRIK
jgi:hypothetical protein